MYTRLLDISRVKPVRIYIQDKLISHPQWQDKGKGDFDVRIWSDGEFDEKEQIFVLEN